MYDGVDESVDVLDDGRETGVCVSVGALSCKSVGVGCSVYVSPAVPGEFSVTPPTISAALDVKEELVKPKVRPSSLVMSGEEEEIVFAVTSSFMKFLCVLSVAVGVCV